MSRCSGHLLPWDVITSYSIHYTKLYEVSSDQFKKPVDPASQAEEAIAKAREIDNTSKGGNGADEALSRGGAAGQGGRFPLDERVNSYLEYPGRFGDSRDGGSRKHGGAVV